MCSNPRINCFQYSNFRKCILKNSQFFCEYFEMKTVSKKNSMGYLSPLKIFTLKIGTPCINVGLGDPLFL